LIPAPQLLYSLCELVDTFIAVGYGLAQKFFQTGPLTPPSFNLDLSCGLKSYVRTNSRLSGKEILSLL